MHPKLLTSIGYAIVALFAMALTVTSPLLPALAASFSLSLAESGLIFSANFLGFVTFILAGGLLADRWGKKPVLVIALLGLALALLLMPLAPSFLAVCALTVLIGGFGGVLESQIGALVTALNPERASYVLNLSQVFFGVGAVVGPVGAGALLAAGQSWRLCYLILGLLALGLAALFVPMRAPRVIAPDPISWRAFSGLVGDPRFLLIGLCMLMYTGAEIGSWGWMSTFLKERMAFSTVQSSVAVAVFWIAVTLGRFLIGPLTLRHDPRTIVIALAVASAVVTALSGLVSSPAGVWAIVALLGLTFSSQWPLILAYGSGRYTAASGTVFALLVGMGGLGTIVVYAMGLIAQYGNIRLAMVSPAILLLAIAAIFARSAPLVPAGVVA